MSTQRARNMVDLIRENVRRGVGSMAEARAFVARISSLSRMEREFLELALRDTEHLEAICAAFPPEARDEPPPVRLVARLGPCGLARPSTDEHHISAG